MHALLFAVALTTLGLHAKPCVEGKTHVAALCGYLGVYENRATGTGRVIPIAFVLLRAKHPSGHAIYFNGGGPGEETVAFAGFFADGNFQKELFTLRDRYDILLMDNRGMGDSHGFNCDLYANQRNYFLELWPHAELAACRQRLLADTDLSAYTTNNAVDDIDDLRAALGYKTIVLDGDSYGTYTSFIYMRRHPEHVESAVLDGVAPPSFLLVPLEDAGGAQLAIDGIIADCKKNPACNASFPQLAAHFAAVAKRFDNGPVSVRVLVKDHKRKQIVTLQLSKQVFADRLRQLMYGPGDYVPFMIEEAYRGDYVPLGMMVDDVTSGLASALDFAANLSYTCAEQVPFITEADVVRTSAGSFLGDARVRAQQQACAFWNVQALPASYNTPVRSDAPILMVSGSNDPTSPAQYAAEALPYLPNARRALVQGAGHVAETDCTDALKVAFVRARSAKDLDMNSCANAFKRPAFKTSMKGFE